MEDGQEISKHIEDGQKRLKEEMKKHMEDGQERLKDERKKYVEDGQERLKEEIKAELYRLSISKAKEELKELERTS